MGQQDQGRPRSRGRRREPLQGSRLKTVREKPRRKAQCRPHGSEGGIYYGPSPNNAEAEVEAEDAVSRSFPFGKYLLMFSVEQGSTHNSTSQTALPALAPALQQLPRLAEEVQSHQPAGRAPMTSCDLPQTPSTHSRTQHPSLPPPPRCIHASSHQPAARTPSNTPTTHPPPNLKRLYLCTAEPPTPLLCPCPSVPFRETSLMP